jgi:DNA-binding NarL/FixJ family response regulator
MDRSSKSHAIRVALVEDNRLLREGLIALIDEQPDLHVVTTLEACDHVVENVHDLKAHIVLLSTSLANHHVMTSIKNGCPDTKLIVMGLLPRQAEVLHFIGAGVSGFLLKEATFYECLATIRSVARGTHVLPSAMIGSLFSAIVDQTVKRDESLLRPAVQLTKREREIVQLIAEGLSNKQIAERLNVATFTVKSHVHNVLEKLALHSRVQLASYCSQAKES